MSSNEPILTVDGVSTRFRTKRGQLRAVEQVSLELDAGETLGLVGESGSGKSVLGQTIMGLVSNGGNTTVTGTVNFMGRDMQGLTRKEQQQMWGNDIAMVFQDPMSALNPFKRIGTHLTESLRAHLGWTRPRRGSGRSNCCARCVFPSRRGGSISTRTSCPAVCVSVW